MRRKGFSLVECLVGMALSLFVVCASLEFFGFAQKLFFKLKESEERGQGVFAALDKAKMDLARAGQGLVPALALEAVEAVREAEGSLTLVRAERIYLLSADVKAGDTRLPLSSVDGLKPGRDICLWDEKSGESGRIVSVDTATRTSVLAAPLHSDYGRETASVRLLEVTTLFLDTAARTLRRRVNLSSAQPLLENVEAVVFLYDKTANLASVRLELADQGEKIHEISVFPKNAGAAVRR